MDAKCKQNERIIELEKKVEYMEKVIQALIRGKEDKMKDVYNTQTKKVVGYKNVFEEEMKTVGSFTQYWGGCF